MFKAWWRPFSHHGVIHGDPHLGNYTVFSEDGAPQGINLLDYGCIRIFPPSFVGGVVDLYRGLLEGDQARVVHAYETWGFKGLTKDLVETLNIWARFIYGPLLEDRMRRIAEGVSPAEYGRKQAFQVHTALKRRGPVTVPREFVFMDRAAIGLGGVFLHLDAELNFHRLFEREIEDFSVETVAARQAQALASAGLSPPAEQLLSRRRLRRRSRLRPRPGRVAIVTHRADVQTARASSGPRRSSPIAGFVWSARSRRERSALPTLDPRDCIRLGALEASSR